MKAPVVLNNYNDIVEELARNCDILIGAAQTKDLQVMREAKGNVDKLNLLAQKSIIKSRKRIV